MTAPTFTELAPYRRYTDALARGALAFQHCDDCDRAVFQPRVNCPHCGSVRLQWRDSAGHGTIYAVTEVAAKEGAYNIVLVDLDEGFRMMSTVLGETPSIGLRVRASVEGGETPRVVFEGVP